MEWHRSTCYSTATTEVSLGASIHWTLMSREKIWRCLWIATFTVYLMKQVVNNLLIIAKMMVFMERIFMYLWLEYTSNYASENFVAPINCCSSCDAKNKVESLAFYFPNFPSLYFLHFALNMVSQSVMLFLNMHDACVKPWNCGAKW